MSIHITPEMAYSYVSFETNMPKTDYMTIVKKVKRILFSAICVTNIKIQVLESFCPGKFVLSFYATRVRF